MSAEDGHPHHQRNTLLLGAVEVGWGTSMALLQPESVLPALVAHLGGGWADSTLLSVLYAAASFPCQVVSPYVSEALPRKKPAVYVLHCVAPLFWAAVGAWLLLGKVVPGTRALVTFFALQFAWNGLLGFLIPLWYDYMAKLLDPGRRGSAFSVIFTLQHVSGFVGTYAIARALLHPEDPAAFPRGFGLCFLVAALAALAGNTAFLFTKEEAGKPPPPRPRLLTYVAGLIQHVRLDRTLARYVLARGLTRLAPVVSILFARQACLQFVTTNPAHLGGAVLVGKLASSLLSWRLSDARGMKPFLVGGWLALAAASALASWTFAFPAPALGVAPWYAVAVLVGLFHAADSAANATFVMNLAPEGKRASYYTAVDAALFPVATLGPWLLGELAEKIGPAPIQGVASVVFVLAAVFLAAFVDERRPSPGAEGAAA